MSHVRASRLQAGVVLVALAVLVSSASQSAGAQTDRAGHRELSVGARSEQPPKNVARPRLRGTPVTGDVLSSGRGTWSGAHPFSFRYQWLRCRAAQRCKTIAKARGTSYVLAAADVGYTVSLRVTAKNSAGQASASSAASLLVAAAPPVGQITPMPSDGSPQPSSPAAGRPPATAPPPKTGAAPVVVAPSSSALPVISGWPLTSGSVLTATSSWAGTGLGFVYSWARCDLRGLSCAPVVSTSRSTYSLGPQDANSTVTVTVTVSNSAGTASATSLPTARIASASSTPTSGPILGVHSDLTFYNDPGFHSTVINADAHVLHAAVSRNSLLWHNIEATKGTFDWSATDDVVNKLVAAGIKPEFTVYGSPSWANGVSTSTAGFYLYVPQDPTVFQQWVNDYTAFLRAAAARYAGTVNLWECGNEENEHFFWKPTPNVSQYLTWYTACRSAILAGNSNAQVAVGGLAGLLYSGAGDINGRSFLQQLIAAGAPIDHVAIHPYAIDNQSPAVHVPWDGNFDDIGQIRDFLDSQGMQNVDIWVTEWGWDSGSIGLQTQADDVRESLKLLKTNFPYVTYAFYFCDFDRPGYNQGLLDSSLNPKPAATVFAQLAQG